MRQLLIVHLFIYCYCCCCRYFAGVTIVHVAAVAVVFAVVDVVTVVAVAVDVGRFLRFMSSFVHLLLLCCSSCR